VVLEGIKRGWFYFYYEVGWVNWCWAVLGDIRVYMDQAKGGNGFGLLGNNMKRSVWFIYQNTTRTIFVIYEN
jgi:hypothetical protein